MEINKATMGISGSRITMTVPFSKVDKERRTVRGFATLDNLDKQGDRILPEANVRAFEKSRRNLREMHANIAAGRVVDFEEQTYYDAKTDTTYKGIFVEAYVSLGAESTWAKVLDGTLQGFSIGGSIIDASREFDKAAGKTIQIIKDYSLDELSLVDNPANPLANIFSVEKVDGHAMIKGMAVDTHLENVFYCSVDELAKTSSESAANCSVCDGDMSNIGWVESAADMSNEIGKVVSKFLSPTESEGGVTKMSDEVITTETVEPEVEVEETVTEPEAEVETEVEVEAEPDVEETDKVDLEKMFDELRDSITKSIDDSRSESEQAIQAKIDEFSKSYQEKFETLENDFAGLRKSLEGMSDAAEKVSKRLDAVEASTSVKKSTDVTSETTVEGEDHSLFKGVFLNDLSK